MTVEEREAAAMEMDDRAISTRKDNSKIRVKLTIFDNKIHEARGFCAECDGIRAKVSNNFTFLISKRLNRCFGGR